MRKILISSAAVSALLIAASPVYAAGKWVAAVPVSGSTATSIFGITNQNVVAGDYVDASGVQHGMTGPFDGSAYKSFDDSDGTTQARGIADDGNVTGFDSGTLVPWERSPKGKLKTIVDKKGKPLNQLAQGLNSSDVFAANSDDAKTGLSYGYTGKSSKLTSTFSISIANNGFAGRGIDAAGDIVGWYLDTSTNLQHGLLIVKGKASTIDVPNATYTVMEGMNDNGLATGQFEDASGAIHGFIYTIKTKKFTQLDAPGSALTQVWGINNNNVIAVSTTDVGSFVYCMTKKGCPKGGADAAVHPVHTHMAPAKP
jgi:hypothetical protein